MSGLSEEYMDRTLFEDDVRGFLFYEDKMNDGSDKYILIFEYNPQTLKKLREGDIVAVESYSTLYNEKSKEEKTYTLLEIIRVKPTHLTIERLKKFRFLGAAKEFVKEATKDFEEDPRLIRDHIYVEAEAVPIGYALKKIGMEHKFIRETVKPILGRDVGLLRSPDIIEQLINYNIEYGKHGVSIGKLYATFEEKMKVDIRINPYKLITHHYSVFAFTGHGKSNLNATIVSKLMKNNQLKVIIFDITDEYTNLLIDVIQENGYIILDENDAPTSIIDFYENPTEENLIKTAKYLAENSKKPGIFDRHEFVDSYRQIYSKILEEKRIKLFNFELFVPINQIRTFRDFMEELKLRTSDKENRYYENMCELAPSVAEKYGISIEDYLDLNVRDEKFVEFVQKLKEKAIHQNSSLRITVEALIEKVKRYKEKRLPDYYVNREWIIEKFIEESSGDKLCIIVSSDKEKLAEIIIEILSYSLQKRKKGIKKHDVLFLIDEAHEFVSSSGEEIERTCSREVERLTRMGRKYGLGICIASQRVAYLNTTAISNCHTTFIGSIPRAYDRNRIKEAYSISDEILSQIVTFPPGHWYVVSNGAIGMNNVPIRFVAENREKVLAKFFESKGFLIDEGKKRLIEVGYLEGENGA